MTEADFYNSEYGGAVADNYSAYDAADNGSLNSSGAPEKASWLDSLQKGLGIVANTAATLAPAAVQFIGAGKGTPQAVASPAAPVLNKYPEPGQVGTQTAKTNFTPWLIGGALALGLGLLVFLGMRKR